MPGQQLHVIVAPSRHTITPDPAQPDGHLLPTGLAGDPRGAHRSLTPRNARMGRSGRPAAKYPGPAATPDSAFRAHKMGERLNWRSLHLLIIFRPAHMYAKSQPPLFGMSSRFRDEFASLPGHLLAVIALSLHQLCRGPGLGPAGGAVRSPAAGSSRCDGSGRPRLCEHAGPAAPCVADPSTPPASAPWPASSRGPG
jgi:hypothetical protein